MLQTILRYFSLVFPHTCARLAYWHLLLFYNNTGLLDLHNVILAILPCCIIFINNFAADRHFRDDNDDDDDDDDDERHQEPRPGPFRVINECIPYWFWVYKTLDLVAGLNDVLRASGFCGKVLLAIDLCMEGTLVLLAKWLFFTSVGLFVGGTLEGFSYVKRFFLSVWVLLQLYILELQGLLEELLEERRERNEVPAEEPPLEEEAIEEGGVF